MMNKIYFLWIITLPALFLAGGCVNHSAHEHPEPADTHDETDHVVFSARQVEELNIKTQTAEGGAISRSITFPGEIIADPNRVTHISSRLGGVVTSVSGRLGGDVIKGQILAVIDSRELADLKSSFASAQERYLLAQSVFERESVLRDKKITSEQDFLASKAALREADIERESIHQKLCALGLTEEEMVCSTDREAIRFSEYFIRAPLTGTIIQKHVTPGEIIGPDDLIFTVANLDHVWVNTTLYQKDLHSIHVGTDARVSVREETPGIKGVIDFVSPVIDSDTRTAMVRMVLPNPDRSLKPGMFASITLTPGDTEVNVRVPAEAVQTVDSISGVFTPLEEGFEFVPVQVGASNEHWVEILSGLKPGDHYVSSGAYQLKSALTVSRMDRHAGHGH